MYVCTCVMTNQKEAKDYQNVWMGGEVCKEEEEEGAQINKTTEF
jgi:hypothetical protein